MRCVGRTNSCSWCSVQSNCTLWTAVCSQWADVEAACSITTSGRITASAGGAARSRAASREKSISAVARWVVSRCGGGGGVHQTRHRTLRRCQCSLSCDQQPTHTHILARTPAPALPRPASRTTRIVNACATTLRLGSPLLRLCGGYNYDSTSIRRAFDGRSTVYQRSLSAQ